MHTEKQLIFDEYAKTKSFDNWAKLVETSTNYGLIKHFYVVCDLVQKAQQERIANSALIRHDLNKLNDPTMAEHGKFFNADGASFYCVESASITSENNLIK